MCNSFPKDWNTATEIQKQCILSIKECLEGLNVMNYHAEGDVHNRIGEASGILVGGNLRTIENLAGTESDISTNDKILFVEDVEEPLYNIDRMFWSLKRTGKLDKLAGLIIGGFKIKEDTEPDDHFSKDLYEIVLEKIKDCSYPVAFHFPVGHQINNFALKCGVKHQLQVTAQNTTLKEITQ